MVSQERVYGHDGKLAAVYNIEKTADSYYTKEEMERRLEFLRHRDMDLGIIPDTRERYTEPLFTKAEMTFLLVGLFAAGYLITKGVIKLW